MKKILTIVLSAFFLFILSSEVLAVSSTGKIICLDPGHGGDDWGTYYPYGSDPLLLEKDLNLDIAQRLKNALEAEGATVGLTRTDDETLSNNDRYTFCNNLGADILISVHHNGSEDDTVDGILGLYHSHKDDKVLADYLQKALFQTLSSVDWKFADFGLDRFASGVLIKSNMPAAMMESLYLTNKNEGPWLLETDSTRRQQIVDGYLTGIENYFANVDPGGDDDDGGGGGGDFCDRKPDHWKCQ